MADARRQILGVEGEDSVDVRDDARSHVDRVDAVPRFRLADLLPGAAGKRAIDQYPDLSVSRPQPRPLGLVLHVEATDTPPVQVQILKAEQAESALATAVIAVNVRYARLPATVHLRVPTPASFVAMKVAAYPERSHATSSTSHDWPTADT